ncbi:MAG: VIT1/CCC1 transporter family protein [Alphaproteobacteria bacterium]|nr:VIT1/CCC1 transporter family protein [Alphaproteobacteria bacterium]
MKEHRESHQSSLPALRDFVLGMSDGLTVPFALAAGLAGAVDSTSLIVTAGLAEIAAGTISMGVGGYLAAKTESDHYTSEYEREMHEIKHVPHVEAGEVADILLEFGVPEKEVPIVAQGIMAHPERWADFMMRFELGLDKPDPHRQLLSPLVIGGAYALGGIIPLVPYMLCKTILAALGASIVVTGAALLVFGAFRGYVTGTGKLKSALQTTATVAIAALSAYMIAKLWG